MEIDLSETRNEATTEALQSSSKTIEQKDLVISDFKAKVQKLEDELREVKKE